MLQRVTIAMDGDKADEFNDAALGLQNAEQELDMAKEALKFDRANSRLKDDVKECQKNLEAAKATYDAVYAEADEYLVEFVFKAVPRDVFEQLLNDSPPTKEQVKRAEEAGEDEPDWNPDTFMPALVAASMISPEITEEEAFDMFSDPNWNLAELTTLFMAALSASNQRKVVNMGKGFGLTQGSD